MAFDPGALQEVGIDAPTLSSVTPGSGQNTLVWTSVSGATAYNIYWSTSTPVTKISGDKLAGVTSPYDHTGLGSGITYYYVVTAEDDIEESDESNELNGTPGVGFGSWVGTNSTGVLSARGASTVASAFYMAGSASQIVTTTLTSLTAGDGTSDSTSSISPSANNLILLGINISWQSAQASAPTLTVSGNGLTYQQAGTPRMYWPTGGNWWNTLYLYRSMGAAPSSGAITISSGSTLMDTMAVSVIQIGNVDTSGSNGSGAIVQYASNAAASASTVTATLGAFASSTNGTIGIFGAGDTSASPRTFTPGSGFTELHDTGLEYASIETVWRVDQDTSVDTTASASSSGIAGLAVEIKSSSYGSAALVQWVGADNTGPATADMDATAALSLVASSTNAATASMTGTALLRMISDAPVADWEGISTATLSPTAAATSAAVLAAGATISGAWGTDSPAIAAFHMTPDLGSTFSAIPDVTGGTVMNTSVTSDCTWHGRSRMVDTRTLGYSRAVGA